MFIIIKMCCACMPKGGGGGGGGGVKLRYFINAIKITFVNHNCSCCLKLLYLQITVSLLVFSLLVVQLVFFGMFNQVQYVLFINCL